MKTHFVILAVFGIGFTKNSAMAQFRGDVYFAESSVAVAAGADATLEIRTFTGASVLGAIHFEFLFGPDELEIVKVEAGTTAEFSNAFRYASFADRIGIVALNAESVAKPFGTISLARLTVRPKVVAGKTISIRVAARDAIDTDAHRLNTRGFGASIAVISPPAMTAAGATSKAKLVSSDALTAPPSTCVEAQKIGEQISRPGHARKIIMPVRTDYGVWVAVEVPVNTVDENAPSDADTHAVSDAHPNPAGTSGEP